MPKFDVHMYEVVRVKVPNIEADSIKEAVEKAEKCYDGHVLFDKICRRYYSIEIEYAEETSGYLIDPLTHDGKIVYEQSKSFFSQEEINELFK